MSNRQNQWEEPPSLTKTLGSIATVIITMSTFFGALSSIFTGLGAPIAALLIGLAVSGFLLYIKFWTSQTAVITWLATSVVVIITFLIISQPATVTGQIIDSQEMPVAGLRLILTNSAGVDQRVVTDQNGNFEVRNVPDGRYTITVETTGMLLSANNVSSGWQRIFRPVENAGGLIYSSSGVVVNASTSTPVALASTDTPIPPTTIPSDIPTDTAVPPTLTSTPSPTDTTMPSPVPTNTVAPTSTPTSTSTVTPSSTPTLTRIPRPTLTPTVTLEPGLIIDENFEDAVAQNFQLGWGQNTPSIIDDGTGNRVWHFRGTRNVQIEMNQTDDYLFTAQFNIVDVGTSPDGHFSVDIRFQDNPCRKYVIYFRPLSTSIDYEDCAADRATNLRHHNVIITEGEWHTISILAQGETITWQIDNGREYSVSDDRIRIGKVGFTTWQIGEVWFDNIRLIRQ